jgi:hypothetical protein
LDPTISLTHHSLTHNTNFIITDSGQPFARKTVGTETGAAITGAGIAGAGTPGVCAAGLNPGETEFVADAFKFNELPAAKPIVNPSINRFFMLSI